MMESPVELYLFGEKVALDEASGSADPRDVFAGFDEIATELFESFDDLATELFRPDESEEP